jgi:hypothetical protein
MIQAALWLHPAEADIHQQATAQGANITHWFKFYHQLKLPSQIETDTHRKR